MNVTVDHLGPCKKLVRIDVPVEGVVAAFEAVTNEFQRVAQLPGFRAGKAPRHLIAKSFEDRIREETRKRLVGESYREACRKEKLNVISTLNVEEQPLSRDLPFGVNITCEVSPDFELPEYKGLTARREISTPSEADVERATSILRNQRVKYNTVERELQAGDVASIHYKATSEGKALTDFNPTARGLTEKQDFWLAIDKESFLPGFTEQLIGARAGDRRTVTVTFSQDFVVKELSGKVAEYAVEVREVKERILPEVNDAFAKEFGAADLAELMTGIRRDLQNELDFQQKKLVRDQLVKHLLEAVKFDLPESVVAGETKAIVYNIVHENQRRGVPREALEEKKDEIYRNAHVSAVEKVRVAFILGRIAEREKLRAEEKEIMGRIAAMAEQQEVPVEKVIKSLRERDGFGEIANEIMLGKALDFLELHGKIDEVPVTRP